MSAQFEHMTQTLYVDGFEIVAGTEPDPDMGPPWEEHDGHGPVSDWTRRDKLPGELVLCDDNPSGLRGSTRRRYYDFAEACRIARRDGWDAKPYNTGEETKRQQAAKAARADFEYLRRWCADQWYWCGVVVTVHKQGLELARASLWGISSDDDEAYLVSVANDLLSEALAEARARIEALAA